jgi:transcriptional regulator with XRE-family HTH domain
VYHFTEVCQESRGGGIMYKQFAVLLEKNNITAYKVSKDTGISQATLSNWKKGKSNPKVDKLLILANYFDVQIGYFLVVGKFKEKNNVR